MPHPTTPPPLAAIGTWDLEVVRGARPGHRYPLAEGAVVLGNGLASATGSAFLNLADQEGASPRKMAAQHAALARSASGEWSIRDLETPGGTFVNNRRVLPGATLPLAAGDVVQLGSVQLRLAHAGGAVPPPSPLGAGVAPGFLYQSVTSGTTCRTWDDFLTFSAQRWDELRDDLIAGRVASFATAQGRPDLAPAPVRGSLTAEQADERLDAWLALLPTRSPAIPELDVHPLRVAISVAAGGMTVVRKIRIANVGYRLLRVRVRLEDVIGAAFTLGVGLTGREDVVRESTEVALEVTVPDPFAGPASATLIVSAAGEEKRVLIQVDRKAVATGPGTEETGPGLGAHPAALPGPIAAFVALPVGKRVVIAALVGLASRLLVGIAGGALGEDAMAASGPDVPRLGGVVVAFAAVGGALGAGWLARRSGRGDAVAGAVAGAGLGSLLAAVGVASCRAIEPNLGPLAASPLVVCGLWGLIGGVCGAIMPRSPRPTEEAGR